MLLCPQFTGRAAMTGRQALEAPQFTITCRRCGQTVPAEPWRWRHECGGTLDVKVFRRSARDGCETRGSRGMARFRRCCRCSMFLQRPSAIRRWRSSSSKA
jgi:ribosomal protein S26